MEQKIKNYVGIAGIAAMLVFAVASLSYVNSYSKSIEPSSYRSFSVSGEGKAVGMPDVAAFTFEIITEGGTDVGALQTANVEKANQAIEFVKSKGVKPEDIRTESYNIEPRWESCNSGGIVSQVPVCPPPKIIGYTVRQSVSVKVRNFVDAGAILSGVVDKGANAASQLSFAIDDPTEVQNKARMEAIAKAQAKAMEVASAGKFKLGRLLSISENEGPEPYYYDKIVEARSFNEGDGIAASPAPDIQPGSEDVHINVSLTYEIL